MASSQNVLRVLVLLQSPMLFSAVPDCAIARLESDSLCRIILNPLHNKKYTSVDLFTMTNHGVHVKSQIFWQQVVYLQIM